MSSSKPLAYIPPPPNLAYSFIFIAGNYSMKA
jgi:hypothetical protein